METDLRHQKIEILLEARARLHSRRSFSICGAIRIHARHLDWKGRDVWDAAEELLTYIQEALRPEWYSVKGWIEVYRPYLPRDEESLRNYRLQWIDWMIFCLENPDLPPPEPKGN